MPSVCVYVVLLCGKQRSWLCFLYPKIFEGEVENLVKCKCLNLEALMPGTQILINTLKWKIENQNNWCEKSYYKTQAILFCIHVGI